MHHAIRWPAILVLLCAVALPAAAGRPVQGFWKSDYRAGVGMFLQQRGDLLAVALLEFRDGRPQWRIGTGLLHGDVAEMQVHVFSAGSCIGCLPHVAPAVEDAGAHLRLQFESARQVVATVDGQHQTWLTPLAFGRRYTDVVLDEWFHNPFGMLPLPDLAGMWAIGSATRGYSFVEIGEAEPAGEAVQFPVQRTFPPTPLRLHCLHETDDVAAGCHLLEGDPPHPLAFAKLGDVTTGQIHFSPAPGQAGAPTVAVRVEPPTYDGNELHSPASGFWSVPGQPGTGALVQHEGSVLGVSLLDFSAGRSHWTLGAAPAGMAAVDVALASYTSDACFTCPAGDLPASPTGISEAVLAFDTARSGALRLDGATDLRLANLDFGADYVPASLFSAAGGLPLPDLRGRWAVPVQSPPAFGLEFTPFHRGGSILELRTGPVAAGGLVRYHGVFEYAPATLVCDPAQAQCRLDVSYLDAEYEPVAELGDVEPDRIRFSVTAIGDGYTVQGVFHAVRIPEDDD